MVHVGDLKVEEVKEGRVVDGERGRHLFIFYFIFLWYIIHFFLSGSRAQGPRPNPGASALRREGVAPRREA